MIAWLHAAALAAGIVVAQADLPNADLPGNSPTLPNSNLIGSLPTDNPITLPNTDTAGDAVTQRQIAAEQYARLQQDDAWKQQMRALTARAVEEAARARADLAEAKQTLKDALEQQQP
ncbi:MAG: hypothetical protein JWM53_1072 [bacterium]|nr:hypothetical protein [bacterium]